MLLICSKIFCIFRYHQKLINSGDSSFISNFPSQIKCIVFEDFRHYLGLESSVRIMLDEFMTSRKIGMVAFLPASTGSKGSKEEHLRGYPLIVYNKLLVKVRPQLLAWFLIRSGILNSWKVIHLISFVLYSNSLHY